jgi:alkaline phosphatase
LRRIESAINGLFTQAKAFRHSAFESRLVASSTFESHSNATSPSNQGALVNVLLTSRRRAIAVAAVATAIMVIPVAATAFGSHEDNSRDARRAIDGGTARNVILLLGDGMGDSEITIARNYQVGAAGRLAMDALPLTGAYTTYAVQKANPTLPDYVTDSAASGTGWATGNKTYNGAISVLPNGTPVPTILELAKKAGYSTGDVSTAELQDATPAVLASHVVSRDC